MTLWCDIATAIAMSARAMQRERKRRECAIPWLVTKTCTQQRNRVAIFICHILSISWLWFRIRFQLVLFANTPSSTPIRHGTWQLSLSDSTSVCSLSDFLAVSVISAALPSLDYWTERPNDRTSWYEVHFIALAVSIDHYCLHLFVITHQLQKHMLNRHTATYTTLLKVSLSSRHSSVRSRSDKIHQQ